MDAKRIEWNFYHNLWSRLKEPERRVASRVGVSEGFFMQKFAGKNRSEDELNLHVRFYVTLMLHDRTS